MYLRNRKIKKDKFKSIYNFFFLEYLINFDLKYIIHKL